MKINPKVMIITGPCGVGKTTITSIISEKLDIELISGDKIRQDLFPEIADISILGMSPPVKLLSEKRYCFHWRSLNTTARSQSPCNKYNPEIIVSEKFISALESGTDFHISPLGETTLRGRNKKIIASHRR